MARKLTSHLRHLWDITFGISAARWLSALQRADISFFYRFHRPPYGGGNQFLTALWKEFRRRGLRLENNRISPSTFACLINSHHFQPDRLARLLRPGCRVVHRIDGPLSIARGRPDEADQLIWQANRRFAQATIFQSRYSLEKHLELGLKMVQPVIIPNAPDPEIFHPHGRVPFDPRRKIRLVSVSWSDNPNKGGAVYRWLEEHLDWERYEYLHIGRTSTPLQKARQLPPIDSHALAALLRQQDIYLTASQHEACSNSLLEALACGLPALYLDSGSNAEIVGQAGLGFSHPDEIPTCLEQLVADYPRFQAGIQLLSLTEVADRYLQVLEGNHP